MAFGLKKETPFMNLFAIEGGKGKFDVEKLAQGFARRNTGWSIPEAYLGLVVATAMADGVYHREEQEEVLKLGRRSRVLAEMSIEQLAATNDIVNERFKTHPNALREACETLPDEMRLAVFGHCVEIALADGELHKSEAIFLENLVSIMALDPREAEQVAEVFILTAKY
ncbi:MAG: tellurite resistance TerB family protein [Myxococcota bacterium]